MLTRKAFFIAISLYFAFACNSNKAKIIPGDIFVLMLADVFVAENVLEYADFPDDFSKYDTLVYQDFIYQKYGFSRRDFDSTLSFYGRNINDYMKIIEAVVERLKVMSAELDDTTEVAEVYAENIWELKNNWVLPDDGEGEKIEFSIPLRGAGTYTLKFSIKVELEKFTESPRTIAYFYKDDPVQKFGKRDYLCNIQHDATMEFGDFLVEKELLDTTYTHIRGELIHHTVDAYIYQTTKVEINDIKLLYHPATTE